METVIKIKHTKPRAMGDPEVSVDYCWGRVMVMVDGLAMTVASHDCISRQPVTGEYGNIQWTIERGE